MIYSTKNNNCANVYLYFLLSCCERRRVQFLYRKLQSSILEFLKKLNKFVVQCNLKKNLYSQLVTAAGLAVLHGLFSAQPQKSSLPAQLNAQIITVSYEKLVSLFLSISCKPKTKKLIILSQNAIMSLKQFFFISVLFL